MTRKRAKIDFDSITPDPSQPDRFLPAYAVALSARSHLARVPSTRTVVASTRPSGVPRPKFRGRGTLPPALPGYAPCQLSPCNGPAPGSDHRIGGSRAFHSPPRRHRVAGRLRGLRSPHL